MSAPDDPDRGLPPDSKLTTTKRQWAETRKFITGRPARPGADRLPPGQHLVRDWPVLDLGLQPDIPLHRWMLDVDGAVESRAHWTFDGFTALPQSTVTTDIHCVTTWSRYDNRFEGVLTADLLEAVRPTAEARHVILHAYDGYTTNVTLQDFAAPDALLAHSFDGQPLTKAHGGPVRLVIPHLYFWKSAKWISRIEFVGDDHPGFWEVRGYHNRGDPWAEQRYSDDGGEDDPGI
ncbi:sulfite oxidase-like oxidoreductase [Chthonobacter rhizosphaerae]|uniref:sulfite oxidase-like oxidoreductase n=1 Tax=Chthonobacter rhizosphaerae TaxID=2735553 RepID=UPI0015EEA06D|nr:sulfite oxidase-like oxidoreductase [Chthonobacter rhizosphaerae]